MTSNLDGSDRSTLRYTSPSITSELNRKIHESAMTVWLRRRLSSRWRRRHGIGIFQRLGRVCWNYALLLDGIDPQMYCANLPGQFTSNRGLPSTWQAAVEMLKFFIEERKHQASALWLSAGVCWFFGGLGRAWVVVFFLWGMVWGRVLGWGWRRGVGRGGVLSYGGVGGVGGGGAWRLGVVGVGGGSWRGVFGGGGVFFYLGCLV